jgi:hypothetical protein
MRTRNIRIRTESGEEQRRRQMEIKRSLKERFQQDINQVDVFIDRMMQTGWTPEDFDSAMMQASNKHRPAMEVSLFYHQKLLDYLHIQQARHTSGQDTAVDPNYAVRHKGQWESMMRRVTYSDGLLIAAAHSLTARMRTIDEDHYWRLMWASFSEMFLHGNSSIKVNTALQDTLSCFAYAYNYAAYGVNTYCWFEDAGDNVKAIDALFFEPVNRYEYLHMVVEPKRSREREGSIYVNKSYLSLSFDRGLSDDAKEELIAKGALMLLCLAFDKLVEDHNENEGHSISKNPIEHFTGYVERVEKPTIEVQPYGDESTIW